MQAVREVLEAWGMSLDLSSILGEGIISDGLIRCADVVDYY